MKKYLGIIIVAFNCISISVLQPPPDTVRDTQSRNVSKTVFINKRSGGPGEAWARTVDHIEEHKIGSADLINPAAGRGRGRGFRVAVGRGVRGGRGRDGSSFGGFDGGDVKRQDEIIVLDENRGGPNRGPGLRPPGYNYPGPPLVDPNYEYVDDGESRFRNGPARWNGWRDYGGRDYGGRPNGGFYYP